MIIASGIASGHVLAADWLFLIAAILFAVGCLLTLAGVVIAQRFTPTVLMLAGLALFAFAFMLL